MEPTAGNRNYRPQMLTKSHTVRGNFGSHIQTRLPDLITNYATHMVSTVVYGDARKNTPVNGFKFYLEEKNAAWCTTEMGFDRQSMGLLQIQLMVGEKTRENDFGGVWFDIPYNRKLVEGKSENTYTTRLRLKHSLIMSNGMKSSINIEHMPVVTCERTLPTTNHYDSADSGYGDYDEDSDEYFGDDEPDFQFLEMRISSRLLFSMIDEKDNRAS
ncbi:8348_t:CDS:2 [Ambispora gerdemannii]|uniref:8348_t:CDS:1 n=1 Tax=Ambispora gerdemannii TaxID=144530 RepID=A0A9N8YKM0_9GLOM|nr:8348_t:CDS:2 [Ambispora gerdemannii]